MGARGDSSCSAADLGALGIDADCVPVLDVPVEGASDVIGDRAFSRDPDVVTALGRVVRALYDAQIYGARDAADSTGLRKVRARRQGVRTRPTRGG